MAGVRRAARAAPGDIRAPEISSPDKKRWNASATVIGEDRPGLAVKPEHLEKLRVPQPPKDSQKPRATSRVLVRKTRPPENSGAGVKACLAKLATDYTDPGGPRFDPQGMVLPHSILGSLEDFRKEIEARGEIELMNRIPDSKKQALFDSEVQKLEEKTKTSLYYEKDHQGDALNHWCHHMDERRRQQNFISNLLQKPLKDLLMNQSNRFRETQEQRELISRGLPALYNGHGAHVGSEFWNFPMHFGDELSGIMGTLTQEERGHAKPITHIKQPYSTRAESGNVLCQRPASKAWSHSQYLKHRQDELREILNDLDFNQPEMDLLEIVGSCEPFTSESVEFRRKQEQNKEDGSEDDHKENEDPLSLFDDVMLELELLPALRINGELALWNGSTNSHQREVGVSVCMIFEAVVGESTYSHLELKNEGSTAIYYSWQKLELPHSFLKARSHAYTQPFYFDTSTAVILPGDTEKILFIFKSVFPGIMTEAWKLHTHPLLMDGAILQVTLKGMAVYQDRTSKQRMALELELEQRVARSVCRSLLFELLHGVRTPERPRSPDELFTTEEEQFHTQNPNLHFHHELVEALKGLWQQAKWPKVTEFGGTEDIPTQGPDWDLSMSNLYEVVMSLPTGDGIINEQKTGLYQEEALSQYNMLLMQLHQAQPTSLPLTVHRIGLQLWRELLDGLVSEALRLRHLFGLPESEVWANIETESEEEPEKMEEVVEQEPKAPPIKEKEEKSSAAKPAAKDKPAEERGRSKIKAKKEEEKVLVIEEKPKIITDSTQQEKSVDPELLRQYQNTLRQQVYILTEKMIDSLGDLLEEAQKIQDRD